MNILIIDGQGGGLGKQLVESIKNNRKDCIITAVGTNSTATAAMLKAGADHAVTGENPVVAGCRKADVIIGPIGIVIADSLFGEIRPKMALAVGQSNAKKVLVPMNHCDNIVVGVEDLSLGKLVQNVIEELARIDMGCE